MSQARLRCKGEKVPGRKRTERVYAASYQSNMRRNDTIQSAVHVTNGFDLAVATMGLGENEESTTMTSTGDLRRKPRLP